MALSAKGKIRETVIGFDWLLKKKKPHNFL